MNAEHRSKGSPTIKIDKTQYLDIRTGEVFETQIQEKRTDDTISLAQSLKNGRDIINTNCEDTEKLKWITLTYKENMQDPKRLKKDIEMFIKNTRYKYGNFEYIICREPQGRGAWHAHIILIFENKAPSASHNGINII